MQYGYLISPLHMYTLYYYCYIIIFLHHERRSRLVQNIHLMQGIPVLNNIAMRFASIMFTVHKSYI